MSGDEDEALSTQKTGSRQIKKPDILALLDRRGITESLIKEAAGLTSLPKITPLRAFFTEVVDSDFGAVDSSWEDIRKHYVTKYEVVHPEEEPEDFRSLIIRDWTNRCWKASQAPAGTNGDTPKVSTADGAGQDDSVPKGTQPPATPPQGDTRRSDPKIGGAKSLEQVNKERADQVQELEAKIKNARTQVLAKQAEEQAALEERI